MIDSSENEFFHCDELSIAAQRDWQRKNLFSQARLPVHHGGGQEKNDTAVWMGLKSEPETSETHNA